MATTKNITMKQFNGTDYDTLYPKTQGSQITGVVPIKSGGTGAINEKTGMFNLLNGLSTITPATNDLFPFKDVSGSTSGLVTLANLITAMGNNGVITTSNLNSQVANLGYTKIQTGSYVGTGTYGASNPCSLTFNFVPKLLIFFNKDCNGLFLTDGYSEVGYIGIVNLTTLTTSYTQGGVVSSSFSDYDGSDYSTINGYSLKSSNGKTIKWYCKGSKSGFTYPRIAEAQLNENNITYYYMGVG